MDTRTALPADIVLDGSYEIRRILGIGGFGITYEALDRGLGRPVALKEYYPAEIGIRQSAMSVRPRSEKDRDLFEKLRASFMREARTLSQFNHPAIVRVLRIFEAHGTAYMVMDLERGSTLKQWLAELGRAPTQAELDRLVEPLLGALELMHKSNFLHRDVAPDNIIVRDDGSPVLLDFGATRRVAAELTSAFTGLVKRGYSPMEQYAQDARAQGPWTDIYALGATLYRCVTGSEPTEATLRVLHDGSPPAAGMGLSGYRPEFLAAIDKAIAIRPEARPQSVGELRAALLGSPPEAAIGSGHLQPADRIGEAAPAGRDGTPGPRPPTPRVPTAWVIAGAFAVVLVGMAVAFHFVVSRPVTKEASVVAGAAGSSGVRLPATEVAPPKPRPAGSIEVAASKSTSAPPAVVERRCDGVVTKVAGASRCLARGEVFRDCPDCPEMVVVAAGEFSMGAPESEAGSLASERPVRKVVFAKPFAITRYEITRKEYEAYLAREKRTLDKGCTEFHVPAPGKLEQRPHVTWSWEAPGYSQTSYHPVVCVSWAEAQEYAASIGKHTGRSYRLPSEAEWEYAARAGASTRYFFGDNERELCDYGNVFDSGTNQAAAGRALVPCKDYSRQTNVVGTYKPNGFGLFDTIGNVWEWVADCSQANYSNAPSDGAAVAVSDCSRRIARGGSFGSHAGNVRAANRWLGHEAGLRVFHIGFRVVRDLD